jgi:filamentous hemagglutinin family protein
MARVHRKSAFHNSASVKVLAALLAAAPMGLSVEAIAAGTLPTNGKYVSGAGSIQGGANSLTIDQASKAGIINWQSFSIGQNNTVQFNNGAGATLNKVTGNNLSQIAGSLKATGSVYLVNPAGVVVTPTGRVLTQGSFGATTGNTTGNIVNQGSIVSTNGDIALSGNDVTNTGAVVSMQGGHIWLNASGTANLGGTISAASAGGAGGTIVATGQTLNVGSTAQINASGTRGGTVLLGGDVHGGTIAADNFASQQVATAQTTSIAKGAQIQANGSQGKGGNIVVWSNGYTSFQGAIQAQGAQGTSGGFAEVSSHGVLAFDGTVDLTSFGGATGTLLLDPENVTISNGTSTGETCTNGTCTPSSDNSILNVGTLEALLGTTNVDVTTGSSGSQTGDITVAVPITWSANTLTLDAYHSIYIGAAMSATSTAGLALTTNDGGTGGDYYFNGGNITFANTNEALTINGTSFTLANTIASLAADISSNPSGDYALANSYNAAVDGTYSQSPITTTFNGIFDGLGNTISNLTINDTNTSDNVGLFSHTASSAVLRNIGIADVSLAVKTSNAAGALVGDNLGSVDSSYATGSVSSSNVGDLGGLVGFDSGSISLSYAAVAVSGGTYNGGLVGYVSGSISQSYATGVVSGGTYNGGLVGDMFGGSLSQSYATGAVSGGTYHGGLVGYDGTTAGSITSSYFDTETSGLLANQGAGNITNDSGIAGFITLQLQSGLPSGFSPSTWAIVSGASFPYLQWQFAGTPQVISGTVLNGGRPYAGLLPQAEANGVALNGVAWSSGANGYYSLLVPQGSIPAGDQLLVYATGANGGATLDENASGSLSNLNIYAKTLFEPTSDNNYSAVVADLGTAIGGDASVQSFVNGLTTQEIGSSAATFTIDSPVNVSTLVLSSSGTVSQTAAITAKSLDLLGSGGSFQLTDSANSIGTLAGNTGTISLDDGANTLLISTALSVSGLLDLTTLNTGNIAIDAAIKGATVDLVSAGTIKQNGSGMITAGTLTGSSAGATTLTAANKIADLGAFSTSAGAFSLTDTAALTVNGAVSVSGGNLTLKATGTNHNLVVDAALTDMGHTVDLISAGTIGSNGAGIITASALKGSSKGAVTLTADNVIGRLGPFSTGNGAFSLTDAGSLTVTGAVNAGTGVLSLTTLNLGNIAIDAKLSGATVDLTSAGDITEISTGAIVTSLLNVTANTGITLMSSLNKIGSVGTDTTNSGPNNIRL